ncbi:NUDIX domain-containing protein [Halioxenophilus sp. WMMB6]|uniref:NUDIX domain-containing protein n=1 Tax=Halioxenophilus sp. WMMB6 TaxID=3073815 RepID=UPI00295F3F23|nr:NUDIX domain-containing protein [Halioxenophilus sp. WMMB6]
MKYCPECASPLAEQLIDDQIRLGCSTLECQFVHWNNPTPVVAVIVEVADGVVMAHNVSWPPDFYSIITGFLETGEDPIECARRETEEELSLVCDEISLVGVYPFARQNQVIIAYHARAWGEVRLNHELDDYKIVPVDELQGWPMATGLAVTEWLAKRRGA